MAPPAPPHAFRRLFPAAVSAVTAGLLACTGISCMKPPAAERGVVPPTTWPRATPAQAGLDPDELEAFRRRMEGHGCVIHQGRLVFEWGDATRRRDVASAVKPLYTHLLLAAVAGGRIPSLDEKVARWEPRLAALNADRGFPGRAITWRHLANQISGYGLAERPGEAFAYNDYQMALFADLLVTGVYGTPWEDADAQVLGPWFSAPLGCEDHPSLLAFGPDDRPGRLMISPRDFARFGQLYLQRGRWGGRQVLPAALAVMAVTEPLPADFPRAGKEPGEMLPGQRSIGSRKIPDNQAEHAASYSWLWWVNGIDEAGRRRWPDAPADTFATLGDWGRHGVAIMPSLGLVASWHDGAPHTPAAENAAFKHLARAAGWRAETKPAP